MKKLIGIFTLAVVLSAGVAFATPKVVSDSFTASMVDNCVIVLDGVSATLAPVSTGADQARCEVDVGAVSEGAHIMTMSTENVWGVSEPVPFDFTKRLPPSLSGIRLEY